MKTTKGGYAIDPIRARPFQSIDRPVPLLTYVAVAAPFAEEAPSKGNWFGYNLDDENYGIFDIFAVPKGVNFQFNMSARIVNTRSSTESFTLKTIELVNCIVVLALRTSTHNQTALSTNLLFQQKEGHTAAIVRVEEAEVVVQIADLRTGATGPTPNSWTQS